ncbi:MAG TPA: divergent polysaccharide deacetylase family protein [Candidatus Cloacimonadota bacterium]|nr:divergent polysaccharide deacetylase family protein [Candidatus Cloacimonadota bacterium]HOR58499.1 divergent polysaccharide deacetylase family protein [Candidatus Cloacimonadota bacterium]HQO44072.1 divergent polysaccharide deacetylase family protein [Candidatus Cloacimonadota bacterium]
MRHLYSVMIIITLLLVIGCRDNVKQDYNTDATEEHSINTLEETPASEEIEKPADKYSELPLSKFSYSWDNGEEIPPIVIIIDDFGNFAGDLLDDFASLPKEVVFAVLPDLPHTQKAGAVAASHGHEVLIHVPMQAVSNTSATGARYIKKNASAEEIVTTLADFHAQLPMAMGANNHTGSAVTANREAMTTVLNYLDSKGLIFIDSATTGESVVPSLAKTLGYPALKRDIFLDVPDNTDATLASKISSLGKFKGRREPIIIITHCHSRAKLNALRKFITQVEGMGLKLTTLKKAQALAS